jgi:hypothetical protein
MDLKELAKSYGAEYYLPNPDGSLALLYRFAKVKRNDGTVSHTLQYLSHAGIWMGSMDNDKAALIEKLVRIDQEDN